MALAIAAPSAFAVNTFGGLHKGSATGAEGYLYTAGETVSTGPTTFDQPTKAAYRYDLIQPDLSVTPLTGCIAGATGVTSAGYTVSPADPASGANGYRIVLEQFFAGPSSKFADNQATCNAASPGLNANIVFAKYFDVVVPRVDGSAGFTGNQTLFSPTQTAFTRFAGVANRNPDTGVASAVALGSTAPQWNVRWLNGTATVCANTGGADRPDSSNAGALPASPPGYLQYPPAAGATGAFNDIASYDPFCAAPTTGPYSAELRLVPASGDPNLSKQVVRVPLFNVDATPPGVTLDATPDTSTPTPSFSGASGALGASGSTFADDGSVTIKIFSGASTAGGAIRTFTKSGSTGSWALSSSDWADQGQSPLNEGLYTVQAEQTDGGGNTGQSTSFFKVDTTAPPVTINSPTASELNDTTPAFAGNAGNGGALSMATADAATVTLRIYSGHTATGSAVRTIPVTKTGNEWAVADQQWTDNSQLPLAAGTYTARAEQFDGAGNEGLSLPVTFKVDPVAPIVAIATPSDGTNTTGATPAIAGTSGTTAPDDFTSADSTAVTVKIYSGTTASGTAQRTFTVNGAAGSWSVSGADWVAAGSLGQGQWTIQAEQADSAGNVGRSAPRTIRVDQQAPSSGTTVVGATNSASITVSYTNADLGTSQSGVSQLALYAKGPGDTAFEQVASASNPPASGSFSYTATNGQGRYFFATVATDRAGNSEPTPAAGGVGKAFTHYDTTAPTVSLDSWPAIGNDTTPVVAGSAGSSLGTGEPAADSATVTVDIWSGTNTNLLPARSIPATRVGGTWALDDSAWTIADPTRAPLTEGTWTARARQSDEAGNTGTSPTPRTFVVDLHAPQSSDNVPTTWQKNPVQAQLSASDTGGSTSTSIRYTTDGSTPTLASPTYSSPITLQNGQAVKYFAVDAAGNQETVRTSPAAKVDESPPATTDNVPAEFQANDVTVTLTAGDTGGSGLGQTYYTLNGTDPTTSSPTYSAANKPILHNGERIKYFSTDVAGNAEPIRTSAAARVDKTAPASQAASPAYARFQTFDVPYTAGDGGSGLKKVELWAKAPSAPDYTLHTTDSSPGTSGSFPYSAVGDGVYSFYTVSEDNLGNRETVNLSGGQVTTTRLDTVAPSTSDNAPAGYVKGDLVVTLSASDPGGSGIASTRYTTDGSTPTSSSTVYTGPVTLTSDNQQLKYLSIDNAGNTEAVRTATARIDRAAPATQASASASSTTNPSFTIGYSAGDTGGSGLDHVELYVKRPNDGAYSLAATDPSPAATGRTFGYPASQGDGDYRFYTVGFDRAGNVEPVNTSDGDGQVLKLTLDRVAPVVTLTSPANGAVLTTATPQFSGAGGSAAGDDSTVAVRIFSGSSATGTPTQVKTPVVSGGAWSVNADALGDGTYTVEARQSDAAGNQQTTVARTFTVDANAPATAITTPANGARTNDATPTIAGTASTLSGDVQHVTLRLYTGPSASGANPQVKTVPVLSDGTWSLSADTLADGTYTAQADQADNAGNHGLSTPVTFTVDTGIPVSQATSPQLTHSTSIALGYSAHDNAGGTGLAKVELWSKGPGEGNYAKVGEVTSPGATGSFTYIATKGDGLYRFYTVAVDRAGNREAAVSSDTETRVGPTSLDSHSPSITSANQGQTYAQGSLVSAEYGCIDEPGGSGIASCTGDVARGAALDTATPGPHSYRVTARDRAGNELGATISYTVAERHVEGDQQDLQAPDVSTAGTLRTQALKAGTLNLDVVCSEACSARAGGTISLPGSAPVHRLKTAAGKGTAGAHVKLKLKLATATLKAVRKVLAKRKRVTAKIKVTATDASGNSRVTTLNVRITKA